MQVYKYDEKTKEYIGTEQALINPLESELQGKEIYLLPANATFAIPVLKDGFASVFNGKQWENIEDNRGKEYWLDTDTFGTPAHTMKDLGAFPAGAVFAAPQKTLDELKADKINEFKFKRDTLEVEPISYQGYRFDYNDKARDRINAAIIALELQGEGASIDWTTADNADTPVTANDLKMIIAAVAVRSNKLHTAYRIAKEKVEEATTAADVEAVTFEV
jgi:hypothetical protein